MKNPPKRRESTPREIRGGLRKLTEQVAVFIARLDREMSGTSAYERGQRIAKLRNALEMANDCAMYFALDYSFKKINAIKENAKSNLLT